METEATALASGCGAAADNLQLQGIARWTVMEFRAKALVEMDSLDAGREATGELMAAEAEFGNHVRLEALHTSARIALWEKDPETALVALDQVAEADISIGRLAIDYMELRAAANRMAGRLDDAVAITNS